VFLNVTQDLIIKGSIKQIRFDPRRFAVICRRFVEACKATGNPVRAVKIMKIAIGKIAPAYHLTPQHSLFLRACLSAKCYKASLPVLDEFVYLIDPKISGVRSEDTRSFYYYGGICYIGLKKWEKAIEFFETVISAPAITASAIMVEAYKKLVLVSLIHKGEVGNLPKQTNQSVVRILKTICNPYEELATAYSTRSLEDLGKVIDNNCKPFLEDFNLGLIGQVKQSLVDQNINRLTATYSTITTAGLLENTGILEVREAEARLMKMVETRGFSAKIHQKDGFISFESNSDAFDTDDTVHHFRDHIKSVVTLHKFVASVDRSIEQSDRYVQKLLQSEKGGFLEGAMGDNRGTGGGGGMMGMGGFAQTMGYHM